MNAADQDVNNAKSVTPNGKLAEKKDEARCHCGSDSQKHLAEFMNNKPSVTHACKCGVVYVVKRGKFVAKQQNGAVAHGA